MRRIRLVIEYDGSGFSGWQAQSGERGHKVTAPPRKLRTVQEQIEKAILDATGEEVRLAASGRTDAGVSALGQVACFRTGSAIPPERFAYALNSKLPRDVTVLSSDEAPPEFHPRRSARRKLYRYSILNRTMRPAVARAHLAHVPEPLDVDRMREGAGYLLGTHDFTSFAAAEATRGKDPVRTITRLDVARDGDRITFEIEGPGFLMHMVRTIVGSLIEVGRGKEEPGWIARVLDERDRSAAGPTAPAEGLVLVSVRYDE